MEHLIAADASARRRGRGRLVGVDAARAIALVGMMTVHLLPAAGSGGQATWYYHLAGGKSSALFAVLAGVGLALATGGRHPPIRGQRWAVAAGIAARALVLAVIGLFLGAVGSGVAVILVHYGFLFLVATLFLGLGPRTLFPLALFWVGAAPALSHWLRLGGQPDPQVPGFESLLAPGALVEDVFLTGYYPVLAWVAYLLAGLAIGRLGLASRNTAALLAGGGGLLAIAAALASNWLRSGPGAGRIGDLPVQFFGTTPTDTWWYLAVDTPHSGSPFDLALTIGTAAAVIGVCLVVASLSPVWLAWLAGAGSMTLTLYTGHVLALAARAGLNDRPRLLGIHFGLALLIGWWWRRWVGRGPLETVAAQASSWARNQVLIPRGR
jgi:uncharacterized membrane protein